MSSYDAFLAISARPCNELAMEEQPSSPAAPPSPGSAASPAAPPSPVTAASPAAPPTPVTAASPDPPPTPASPAPPPTPGTPATAAAGQVVDTLVDDVAAVDLDAGADVGLASFTPLD